MLEKFARSSTMCGVACVRAILSQSNDPPGGGGGSRGWAGCYGALSGSEVFKSARTADRGGQPRRGKRRNWRGGRRQGCGGRPHVAAGNGTAPHEPRPADESPVH